MVLKELLSNQFSGYPWTATQVRIRRPGSIAILQYNFHWWYFFTSLLNTKNASAQNGQKDTVYLNDSQPHIQSIISYVVRTLHKNKSRV